MDKIANHIKKQGFKNEYDIILKLNLDQTTLQIKHIDDFDDDIVYYWTSGSDGSRAFNLLYDAHKLNIGDTVDLQFLSNYYHEGILKRDFNEDFGTYEALITKKTYYYHPLDYDNNGDEFSPIICPKPILFLTICPMAIDYDNEL